MVIWIMGLSGSGKTTLAKIIYKLIKKNNTVLHIDGDEIRKIYNEKLGYSLKEREINAQRISKLTKFVSLQSHVIVSVLSNFPYWLKWNRINIKKYFEIYLKNNTAILKYRRPNLYSKKIKNVVGLDIKYKQPKNPDLIIENCTSIKELKLIAGRIVKKLKLN
jgi:adenylylsulfate kinase